MAVASPVVSARVIHRALGLRRVRIRSVEGSYDVLASSRSRRVFGRDVLAATTRDG
ncbi:hypothetical protein SGLAM104S_02535 [Streptomyces glaucescens]